MACPGENTITALLDARLAPDDAADVRAHIAECAACTAVYALLVSGPAPADSDAAGGVNARGTATLSGPQPARLIGGRYRLGRLLGHGGMGTVWAAEHVITKKQVALKLLHAVRAAQPHQRKRLLREARAASAVRHPNAVPVLDVFEDEDGAPVLIMDLLEGEPLRLRLDRDKRLVPAELARLLVPAIAAVQTAHAAGVIHRDLKPDNLFLVRGEGGAVDLRVLDFGLAKLTQPADDSTLTRSGEILGTPAYMAPEQAFGEPDVDARADVWALGVILYECLSGRRPFAGDNAGPVLKAIMVGRFQSLAFVAPELPPELSALVDRMLSVQRRRRPPLDEVVQILDRVAAGRGGEIAQRHAGLRLYVAGAVVVIAALGGASLYVRRAPAPARIPAVSSSPPPLPDPVRDAAVTSGEVAAPRIQAPDPEVPRPTRESAGFGKKRIRPVPAKPPAGAYEQLESQLK